MSLLPDATLDQVRAFATAELPFGLWQTKSGCNLSSQPSVQSFTGANRPHWMDVVDAPANAPVYGCAKRRAPRSSR